MNRPYGQEEWTEPEVESRGESSSGAPQPVKLTQIEQLILLADASAISAEGRVKARKGLAASLGCTIEDIEDIVSERGEEEWERILVEERVRRGMNSVAMRDVSWDRLEAAALRKLVALVESDRISNHGELLAMATKANSANRGKNGRHQPQGNGLTVNQLNQTFFPGNPEEGVLPSGHLGNMTLRLSHRTRKQIEGRVEKPESEGRTLDNMEMLGLNDIQEAVSGEPEES